MFVGWVNKFKNDWLEKPVNTGGCQPSPLLLSRGQLAHLDQRLKVQKTHSVWRHRPVHEHAWVMCCESTGVCAQASTFMCACVCVFLCTCVCAQMCKSVCLEKSDLEVQPYFKDIAPWKRRSKFPEVIKKAWSMRREDDRREKKILLLACFIHCFW